MNEWTQVRITRVGCLSLLQFDRTIYIYEGQACVIYVVIYYLSIILIPALTPSKSTHVLHNRSSYKPGFLSSHKNLYDSIAFLYTTYIWKEQACVICHISIYFTPSFFEFKARSTRSISSYSRVQKSGSLSSQTNRRLLIFCTPLMSRMSNISLYLTPKSASSC